MSSRGNKTVLGDDWYKTFSTFRLNIDTFLDRRKLTRDAFCLDVLKDLYSDNIEIQNKIHLLLLLQEFSSQLITDINLLEQVVESLTNLYNVLGKKPDKRLLKSQILVSIMTILLTINLDQDISKFIMKTKLFLLQIIYGTSEDSIITTSACNCLEELETFYPGILEPEIDNILLSCEKETSPAFQSYALLLNTCSIYISAKEKSPTRKSSDDSLSPRNAQVTPIISSLLELLPLMLPIAQYRVLKNLIKIVKNTSQLSPKTFKLYFSNLSTSTEVSLFSLALDLLITFGSDLLSTQEEKFFLSQLVKLSTHPCLTSSNRLLYLEYLKCLLKYNNNMISYLLASDLQLLLPTPFDGPLTQEKKIHILVLCIPSNCDEQIGGDFLNEAASGLIKCSLIPGGSKTGPSLFRILFLYFSSQTTESVSDLIYKLLTNLMKTSLHLIPNALNFINCVKSDHPDRNFHEKILNHMVEHILSVPVKQVHFNIKYYLTILEIATHEHATICRPRAVLRLFQKLFNNVQIENSWGMGNDILSLCRSFMKNHDVQTFYYDLAEVLCLVIQHFKDADVKDRAKIYYSMLTSLSKMKLQTIFALHSSEKVGKNTLNSFVTGGESLQFASSIQKLAKPVLQIARTVPVINQMQNEWPDSVKESIPDILKIYVQHLAANESSLYLPLTLKHVPEVEKSFVELFSIIITTHSKPACKNISVMEIPVLKQSSSATSGDKVISLKILPMESQPLTLYFRAEFTCSNGYSYICYPSSVMLNIDDLFLPLPVPESHSSNQLAWKQALFDDLWNNFKQKIDKKEKESKCCQSVFALKIKNEEFPSFVENKWQNFIVYKQSLDYHIAIYLPPKNHLLFKISIVNNEPFVNILVDNYSILPYIMLYLQNINDSNARDS